MPTRIRDWWKQAGETRRKNLDEAYRGVVPLVRRLRTEECSYRGIAEYPNQEKIPARWGRRRMGETVQNVLRHLFSHKV